MRTLTLEAEAGRLSAELARRGIGGRTRVCVVIDVIGADELSMAASWVAPRRDG